MTAKRVGLGIAAVLAVALGGALPGQAQAQRTGANPAAEAQALELLKRGIGFRTVSGPGNQTPEYAAYLKQALVAGGFADADVEIVPIEDTAYLVARYRGTGKGADTRPIYLSGHMDVVAANPADWERDPFTAVVENGYVFGRGATDMKYDVSTMVATLIQLKKEGFKPRRDIVLLLSGDEETAMKTTAAMSERFHDAKLLLNIDGGGGGLDANGDPVAFYVDGAEKTYADFELSVTDPGGHSSAPKRRNAITILARALTRIGAFDFPGEINDITRASIVATKDLESPEIRTALERFLVNQQDPAALAVLRAEPGWIGQIGTTCVATMVKAGHAPNALPQAATANVNCRIFPGTPIETIRAKLVDVAAEPDVTIRHLDSGSRASDASPLDPKLMAVIGDAIHARFPGIPIVPGMSAGASDSMFFRAKGVPSYGGSPVFMKDSDHFSHGLNERTPLSEIAPSIVYYKRVLAALAQ